MVVGESCDVIMIAMTACLAERSSLFSSPSSSISGCEDLLSEPGIFQTIPGGQWKTRRGRQAAVESGDRWSLQILTLRA